MQPGYFVGAYWGPRKETALECARRAELFFHLLSRCDPALSQWFHSGRGAPRDLPGWPVQPEIEHLEKFLLKTRRRTDVGKKVIDDMGFGSILWNAGEPPAYIHLGCGSYSRGGNMCLLYPPKAGPVQERLLHAPIVAEILTSMVKAWDPDFAVVTSDDMWDAVKKQRREVDVGWLTYLSRRLGSLPPLPAPVRIEPVGSLGWLLVLAPERMSASNPEQVSFTRKIRQLLDRAGLIERPEPEPESPEE